MNNFKTEDVVLNEAGKKLGFNDKLSNEKLRIGVGQGTTFKKLGFKGENNRPDGWYLPQDPNDVAIILETKNSNEDISKEKWVKELLANVKIVSKKYNKVIGILYNGVDVGTYKNEIKVEDAAQELQDKKYYLSLFNEDNIDRNKIYTITRRINNTLHFEFKINNLYHRMIFTACALVAERYEAQLKNVKGKSYSEFHTAIHSTLAKSLQKNKKSNSKINVLLEVYSEIQMCQEVNQEIIDSFLDDVIEISESINSDYWNGEDVMAIFFHEFNRYKGKSEHGQIFTPEHIASLMYRIINISKNDLVLDAACGSGTFLVKAMSKMIKDAGGINTSKANNIKTKQLFGIELDREIFALACANMLIHKDGRTNLRKSDACTPEAGKWIKGKKITRVLMNPPYENKNGCIDIVINVLDNVRKDTICAFILPDRKLETVKKAKKILKKHCLTKIIKLPEETFDDGSGTSIFIFNAGTPQNGKTIFGCHIKEDGLERVKNQGRHDINKKWNEIENEWVEIIEKQTGHDSIQWIPPNKGLEYILPMDSFSLSKIDFKKCILSYILFKNNTSLKDIQANITDHILYNNCLCEFEKKIIEFGKDTKDDTGIDVSNWKEFSVTDLFEVSGSKTTKKSELNLEKGGSFPYITTAATNNGVSGFSESWTEDENVITVDSATDGIAFFQDKRFSASDHVEKLTPKFKINLHIALFMVTILNINSKRYRYSYERKRSQTAIKEEVLYLPVNEDGTPNYDDMEKMIKSVNYAKLLIDIT